MRWFFITISLLLFAKGYTTAQVSQGGRPMEVPALKSRKIPEKVMPALNNRRLREEAAARHKQGQGLKPFRFAKDFSVHISPERDGVWTTNIRGTDVWQFKIHSPGAFSLNLIFSEFHLPQGARLFLFNEKKGHFLGAFTSLNNKASGKFAVSPVAGDELTVQYEIPAGHDVKNNFIITQVNHDFTGILKNERRPLWPDIAGDCNIDINCNQGADWNEVKNAVCRLIVNGSEICTGTLINNTNEDETPYIISAAHCFDKSQYAQTTVFTFNYESPYCAPLDGDPSHSVSGAVLRAQSDSLDFALTELSLIPPPEYRPWYAGWDNTGSLPDSSVSIHHPQGDIKKIAFDRNQPEFSNYTSDYTPNGFLRIKRWDAGVTEAGSSGGALFNYGKKLIGTLTGGEALCSKPVNDFFSRFDIAWEYKSSPSKQLKYWLDPFDTGLKKLEGKRFYEDENFCMAFTNLTDEDAHQNVPLVDRIGFSGYWGGTNSLGITEITERFSIPGNEQLAGISLGIGKIKFSGTIGEQDSEITLKVYNGSSVPEKLIYSQPVKIKNLTTNAMNYIGFTEMIEPSDTFFIGFELSNLSLNDTLVVYQSLRPAHKENFFFFKQNGSWENFKSANTENYSMANVFELVACNVELLFNDTLLVKNPMEALIYPNPAQGIFTFEAGQAIDPENIHVFNLLGQVVDAKLMNSRKKKIQIDLSGNHPGVYFVRFETATGSISKKISWIGR